MDSNLKPWLCWTVMLLLVSSEVHAARGGVGRRGGSRKTGSLGDSGTQILPRNQHGASYYDNTNVHEWAIGNDTLKSTMEIGYECQADNQYAIDRRGFRTDYVTYTY